MIIIPAPNGTLAIITPGNIKRLKEGKSLRINNLTIAFTPDANALLAHLGSEHAMPASNAPPRVQDVNIPFEKLVEALKKCQNYPEADE